MLSSFSQGILERIMSLLARFLDWLCGAFASGAQDAVRLNQLICPLSRRLDQSDGAGRR